MTCPGKVLWTVHRGYVTLENGALAELGTESPQ